MSSECTRKLRKRKSISLDMKIEILNRLERLEKPSSIAKSYGINESTIRTIKKMERSIRSSVSSGSLTSLRCSSYTRNPAIEAMEKELMIWIADKVQRRVPVNSSTIRQEAVNIYNSSRERRSSDQQPNFSGSKGWFEKFKKRYSLHYHMGDNGELLDRELIDDELIDMMSAHNETHPADESGSDADESAPFTAQSIHGALQLAAELESAILHMDPNVQRASRFRRDLRRCCAEYREIYESLSKKNLEEKPAGERYAGDEIKVEVLSISPEDFASIKKKRPIAVNCSTDNE
ncbi:PREDICTED: tigger transposable element-derived protein 2-like [Vollenhovia emeryi]|uniref:tigger transposable element-derived protein 2-like n=1 Tax=Vollenhovia emeryi TaxID=411798 RepID=UPI0005F4159C|nr:PREDICTED: tigger transposable element-derived protein 2-like [Vollenhovia emeryi]